MLNAGAEAGAISLGSAGLIWQSMNGDALFADAPKLSAQSCVGSGDATWPGLPLPHSSDCRRRSRTTRGSRADRPTASAPGQAAPGRRILPV